MKEAETAIIPELAQIGKVSLVTKLSKKPAVTKTGTNPTANFRPFFAPLLKDSIRENVPGKIRLFPMTSPAAPAITMADISSVP